MFESQIENNKTIFGMNGCTQVARLTVDYLGYDGKMAAPEAIDQSNESRATAAVEDCSQLTTESMTTTDPRNLITDHFSPQNPERCANTTLYQNGFSPSHQDEPKPQEINNNSERILDIEHQVIEILSTKDCRTVHDIHKSLPAVTSPKCVNATMSNLEKKGFVKVLENQHLTRMKANLELSDRRYPFNGCSSMHTKNATPLYSNSPSFHDDFQDLHFSTDEERIHTGENTLNSKFPCRSRSVSSPCFPFHKQTAPEISKSTRNGLCRGHSPRMSFGRRKATEQELHNGSHFDRTNGLQGFESKDKEIWELLMTNSASEGDQTKNGQCLFLDNLPRKKFSLGSSQKRINEALNHKRRSPGFLHMVNDVEIGENGMRCLSIESSKTAQHFKQERSFQSSSKYRRDPGIIGEERNCRRKSSPEQIWSPPARRFSSSAYEGSTEIKQSPRNFAANGETKSCGLCKISFMSKQQSEEHFKSTKHLNKIAKVTSEPYLKFCDYCKVGLNSKSQAIEHFSSGRHEQTVAKSQKAPIRNHPPLKVPTEQDFEPMIYTDTKPYGYQMELYYKAITTNSVCFLPTGTGKTLVAALVLAHLLQLNPSRQIIFLVDRVLLVLQQSDYLKSELKHVQIPLLAKNEEQLRSNCLGQYSSPGMSPLRPLRIGAICGEMRKLEQGIPIFDHDILVVTADCYRNHITNGTLRFEDSALIVLDESHHCNKDHPYNVIIRDYYLPDEIPMFHRPKILGLTASPAGEFTLDRTLKKMQRLLLNLGGANLLTVTDHAQELAEKTNRAEIVCQYAEYTTKEKTLLGILMEYATKCFNLAARVTEFKEYKDVFQPSSGGVLSKDDIYPILGVIDKLLGSFKHHSLSHFQIICDSICTLQECGEKLACDRMAELRYPNCAYGFDWALDQGLPCENLRSYLDNLDSRVIDFYCTDDTNSGVTELLKLLAKLDLERKEDETLSHPIVFVLVKRFPTAVSLAEHLDGCPVLRGRGIRAMFIGGAEPDDWGRTNGQQRDASLPNTKEGAFKVAVATNVEELKLDDSTAKLVVQLDPPNSTSALAQIRVRARGKHTLCAAIGRDKDFGRKMKDILLRENSMLQAATIINGPNVPGIY